MSNELTLDDKAAILFKNGFLRFEDKENVERIKSRWQIYQTVPQKTPRANKSDPPKQS